MIHFSVWCKIIRIDFFFHLSCIDIYYVHSLNQRYLCYSFTEYQNQKTYWLFFGQLEKNVTFLCPFKGGFRLRPGWNKWGTSYLILNQFKKRQRFQRSGAPWGKITKMCLLTAWCIRQLQAQTWLYLQQQSSPLTRNSTDLWKAAWCQRPHRLLGNKYKE